MKKILLMATVLLVAQSALFAVTVPNFSFEDPDRTGINPSYSSGNPTGWTFTSGVNWGVEEIRDGRFGGYMPLDAPGDGDQVAYINIGSSGTGSATSDVVGQILAGTTYTLTIAIAERSAGDKNSDGSIGLLIDGAAAGTFTDYDASALTDGAITDVIYTYTATAADAGKDFQIRMDFTYDADGGGWQQAQFDNVRLAITGEVNNPSPHEPDYNPLIAISENFTWDAPTDVTGIIEYDIYVDPNANNVANSDAGCLYTPTDDAVKTDTLFDPPTDLAYGTIYYWKVITVTDSNSYAGPVFEFKTVTESPSVNADGHPVSVTVPLAGTALFTAAGTNQTKSVWKKDGIDVTGEILDGQVVAIPGGKYTVDNTVPGQSTLEIAGVIQGDEADYSCVLINDAGTAESNPAQLMAERLIGWWKMDGDPNDSVQEEFPGVPTHDGVPTGAEPNYITGVSNLAADFDGTKIIEISDSADYFGFFTRGFTLSLWVKDAIGAQFDTLVDKLGVFTLRQTNTGDVEFTITGVGTASAQVSSDWHLLTGTYDPDAGKLKLYVDGVIVAETEVSVAAANSSSLITLANSFEGLIDDMRILSYPLDPLDVALLYTNIMIGETVCTQYPYLDVAGENGIGDEYRDCKVDLYDFAALAAHWLECNIVPDCQP